MAVSACSSSKKDDEYEMGDKMMQDQMMQMAPFSNPYQNNQAGQMGSFDMQSKMQTQKPLIRAISEEYKNVAKLFLAKKGDKQYDYFNSKASDVLQSGFIEFEIVPNDILKNTNDPKLKSIYDKEALVKKSVESLNDDKITSKLIATYDCAVVDILESLISGTQELTTCYDDLNIMALSLNFKTEEPKTEETPKAVEPSTLKANSLIALAQLKPFTEQVSKTFSVIEFDKGSQTVDISYYENFKSIANVIKAFDGDYKVTIIGYELYDESDFQTIKKKKGKGEIKKKRKPSAIAAAKNVNNMLKARALTVRKMLVSNGVDDNKIVIAHPEATKVKFLYNVKDGPKGENILENLIILDIKLDDKIQTMAPKAEMQTK